MMTDELDAKPRSLEFVCDRCLFSTMGNDMAPIPRCPRCGIRLTPDDLAVPFDRFSCSARR